MAIMILTFHPAVCIIPMWFTFWMTSNYTNVVLYNCHRVAVHISCYCLKFTFISNCSKPIIKEHFFFLTIDLFQIGQAQRRPVSVSVA